MEGAAIIAFDGDDAFGRESVLSPAVGLARSMAIPWKLAGLG